MPTKDTSVTTAESRPSASDEREVDEDVQVVGDPLVRVVRAAVQQLQPVVGAVLHPVAEVALGEPAAPLDEQHLLEVLPVGDREDVDHREQRELAELPVELRLVLRLEGGVEIPVPGIEAHLVPDPGQRQRDHRDEQDQAFRALAGSPVGPDERPDAWGRKAFFAWSYLGSFLFSVAGSLQNGRGRARMPQCSRFTASGRRRSNRPDIFSYSCTRAAPMRAR